MLVPRGVKYNIIKKKFNNFSSFQGFVSCLGFFFFRKTMFRWLLPEGAASLKRIIIRNRNTGKLLWHKVHMALSMWPTSCLERFPAAFIFPCCIPRGLSVAVSCRQCSDALVLYWWMIFTFTSCFSVPEHCIVLAWIYLNSLIKRWFCLVWGDAIRDECTCRSTNSWDLVADFMSAWCFPWWSWHQLPCQQGKIASAKCDFWNAGKVVLMWHKLL